MLALRRTEEGHDVSRPYKTKNEGEKRAAQTVRSAECALAARPKRVMPHCSENSWNRRRWEGGKIETRKGKWGEKSGAEVAMTLEEAMVKVWRQALVEGAAEVELNGKTFAVRETPRKRLREVDFEFEGQPSRRTIRDTKIVLRGLEQNPKTESRWAQLARAGHKVMQFLSAGRYIGVVVDGKVTLYGGRKKSAN